MWQEEVITCRYPENEHVSLFSITDIRNREMFS